MIMFSRFRCTRHRTLHDALLLLLTGVSLVAFTLSTQAATQAAAQAALDVVATSPAMGMLVREVGTGLTDVTVLANGDRDLHTLQVKPSMMLALRKADLVVAVGAELEVGWLPPALSGAANPRVQPGSTGYFEATAQVALRDANQKADRAQGDVHISGNPHIQLDPERMAQVALKLAERLASLDQAHASAYKSNAARLAATLREKLAAWQQQTKNKGPVLLYHKDADYLMTVLSVPVAGYLELIPGVPPTPQHILTLASSLRGKTGVILHAPWQVNGVERMATTLGWPVHVLPQEPAGKGTLTDYTALIERWVNAIAQAHP